jgi:hypothetical protein
MDRICQGFLWKGTDSAGGGHCLVDGPKSEDPSASEGWEFLI